MLMLNKVSNILDIVGNKEIGLEFLKMRGHNSCT